jgi:tripartite-type tricarboxylate transporter receptor subunit TctC
LYLDRENLMNPIARLVARSAALLIAGTSLADAATYPVHPVRIIVPFAPAGPADIVARLLAQKLGEQFGKQFYVENQPGAGGNIGMGNAARAAADGHTLVLVSSSYMVNPSLYPKVPYDQGKDFAPVTMPAYAPNVLIANPSLPVGNLKDLAALVKANPGKMSFASAGMGTTPYLSGELFKLSLNADLVHVPFNGSAPAIQSTLGGHTPFGFVVLAPAVPQVKDGKLRGLAVLSAQRSSALPDVPTIAEAGFPGQEADTLLGVLAPAGTPREIVELLHREIVRVVARLDVRERLDAIGFVPVGNTPGEFAAIIKAETARWGKVIKDANIKAEP